MNCPKCGLFNPDGAQTCSACHSLLTNGAVPIGPHIAPIPSIQPVVSPELKWGVFAGTIVIPLVGLIMGIMYLASPDPHKKPTGTLWLITGLVASVLYWRTLVV